MSEFRNKLKNIFGDQKRRVIISACVMIAVALAMLFTALIAPFQYFSDRDVLHIVYVEVDDVSGDVADGNGSEGGDNAVGEEATVTVNETRRVHQSLFQLFEAVTMLGDASTLHAASNGEIYDQRDYEEARERLTELRAEYEQIVKRTEQEAEKKNIAQKSDEYTDLLADNLSDMNLAALDMLETAFASDNDGSYETVYGGIVLALFNGIINLLIIIVAIVAIVFSIIWLITKSQKTRYSLLFAIFTALSLTGLLMCVFNTVVPPAACPLALACISVSAFFVSGLSRAVLGDAPVRNVVRNGVAAALVSVGTLCLASLPSLTLYVKSLGLYPGTVGTVSFSRLKAGQELGLEITSAMSEAFTIGIILSALSVVAAVIALDRLYHGSKNKGGLFSALLAVIAIVALVMCVVVSSKSGVLDEQAISIKYIVGACWYVLLAFMIATAVMLWVFAFIERRKGSSAQEAVSDAESGNAEGGQDDAVVHDEPIDEQTKENEKTGVSENSQE